MESYFEIKRQYSHFVFVWAITELLDKGIEKSKRITNDDILKAHNAEIKRQQKLNGICLYTPECVRDMLVVQRKLANLKFEDLINGIVKDDLWKAHKISWDRMCEIASAAIQNLDVLEVEDFIFDCEMDEDECDYFEVKRRENDE